MNIDIFCTQKELAAMVRLCERISYNNACHNCVLGGLCEVVRDDSADVITGIEDVVKFLIGDGVDDGN